MAFAVATQLYLIQATGLIGSEPTYALTAAGQPQDEETYWVAYFAYRHDNLWNYVLRDGLFFVAFLGFIPLALAANVATGGRRAAVQIGWRRSSERRESASRITGMAVRACNSA